MQSLSQNRQLAPSSYDAQELTDTVMNILGLVAEDDTPDAPVARELAQVQFAFLSESFTCTTGFQNQPAIEIAIVFFRSSDC